MILFYTHSYGGGRDESHELLRKVTELYTGSSPESFRLISSIRKTGRFGRPVIDGFPDFSISHSNNTWAVLIDGQESYRSPDDPEHGRLGLDIQYARKCNILSIARRIYEPGDAEAVIRACERGEDAAGLFVRIWTRREALIKAAGGTVMDGSVPSVLGRIAEYDGYMWNIEDIRIPGAPELYAASVCMMGMENVITEAIDLQELQNG